MVGGEDMGGLRVELDMAIGETSAIESTDKGKMEDLVGRIRDLNGRLGDVRREQVFQRVSLLRALIGAFPLRDIASVSITLGDTELITRYRNEKPNSATNPNPPTPKSSATQSSSSSS